MYRRFCLASLIAISMLCGPHSLANAGQDTLRGVPDYQADVRAWRVARDSLGRAVNFAHSRVDLFNPADTDKQTLMPRAEKLTIWNAWSAVLDSQAVLERLRHKYRRFIQWPEEQRAAAFALTHAAFLTAYRYALEWIALADHNPSLDIILNEAVPELGLSAHTFDRFKFRFLNVAVATEFGAMQTLAKTFANNLQILEAAIAADSGVIWQMGKGKGPVLTLKNALSIVQKAAVGAWFPVQKGVAEWMGDTKVHRKGVHLISGEQIAAMRSQLQPGDILFERHEWYLSNLGLPGFWTHVALYIGTPNERRLFFSDGQVRRWVQDQGGHTGDFETLLGNRYPAAFAASTRPTAQGLLPCILEAISEGVSFTALEDSAAADSIAVVRPRLAKREIAQAIMRAFHYSGRPYDFNFDFETDASLVCSELVFKAYAPGAGMQGLRFPLIEVMGRTVSPPNAMVRQFDEQYDSVGAQVDFVLFLDGFEKGRRALVSTAEQFRRSWKRPNWHILIQDAPRPADQIAN